MKLFLQCAISREKINTEVKKLITEEINKIALSLNDDKRMQSIDSIEKYASGTSNDLLSDKEEIKSNNMIKRYKK